MSFKVYRDLQPNEFLVAGYDMAMGGDDYSAVPFISKTYQDVPLIYHEKETATITTNRILPILSKIKAITHVKSTIAPETNAGGVYEIDRMLHSSNAIDFNMYTQKAGAGSLDGTEPAKYGWTTNTATRPKMLEELKTIIDGNLIMIYDKSIINELFSFVINKTLSGWKAQAERGSHDDLCMALAIAVQLYLYEKAPTTDGQVNSVKEYNAQKRTKWRLG